MKVLLFALVLLLIPTLAAAQVFVEFEWTQPDSTVGTTLTDGTTCCKVALADGDLVKWEIFVATPTDTLYWGEVAAPATIAEMAVAAVPVDMLVPTSIATRSVDINGRTSDLSAFSDPFTVDPGPPAVGGVPVARRVYIGG